MNPNKDTVTAEIQLDGMITNGGPGGETVTTLLQWIVGDGGVMRILNAQSHNEYTTIPMESKWINN